MSLRGVKRRQPGLPGAHADGNNGAGKAPLVVSDPPRNSIRELHVNDLPILREIHRANGLDARCFPDLNDPLFMAKEVFEYDGCPAMATFLKGTSELYLLVDHTVGTPEQRWEWLLELTNHMRQKAWKLGLNEMTCWIQPEIEKSFAKRLVELGFIRSEWHSWTMLL